MADLGAGVTSIGVFFTAMLALGAIGSIFISSASRRLGKRSLILGSILAGVPFALAGILLLPSPLGGALLILSGAIFTVSNPILLLFAQAYAGGSPAVASSLIMGVSWGAAGLLMMPFGGIGEAIGMRNMLLIAGAFPLVGILSCLRMPRQ
jgi:FSR family fosmidomycin resistance protein-like MFS transporter